MQSQVGGVVCAIYVTLAHVSHIVFKGYLGLLAFVVGTDWLGENRLALSPAARPGAMCQRVSSSIRYIINFRCR